MTTSPRSTRLLTMRQCLGLFGALLALIPAAAAAEPAPACTELHGLDADALAAFSFTESVESAQLLAPETRFQIGEIRVLRQPIFNPNLPTERNLLFRSANRLHRTTSEQAVRNLLLFAPGDEISVRLLLASERNLRQQPYLYDARVLPRRRCGDQVDIDVITRDVWTLNPRARFSRSGGDNKYGFGISDPNVLGTGKNLSVGFERDQDRSGVTFYYRDLNLLRSDWALRAQATDNDDGDVYGFELIKPFLDLETTHTLGISAERARYDQGLYAFRQPLAEFRRESRRLRLLAGRAYPLTSTSTWRWEAGAHYRDELFFPLPDAPAAPLPADRRQIYPWLALSHYHDAFVTTSNLDRIARTEDIFLGSLIRTELGFAHPAFGSDDRRWLWLTEYQQAWLPNGKAQDPTAALRQLLTWSVNLGGQWSLTQGRSEALLLESRLDYHWRQHARWGFHASLQGSYLRNPFPEQQLLLSGDTGLRGYPNRYQPGDRLLLLSLEERYYTNIYPWQLFRLGGALFLDVGRAWFPGADHSTDQGTGTLSNLGLGLRFESTRTRRDRVGHLDLAFPLRDTPGARSRQISLSGRQSF